MAANTVPRPSDSIGTAVDLHGELYRVLAESAPDAIITIDENSVIIAANSAVERLFGYAPDDLIGKPLSLLMPARMHGAHYAGVARYTGTGVRHVSWQSLRLPILTRAGAEVPVEVSFGEFISGGRRVFSGFLRDISDRVAAEHAVSTARREAEARATEAEQLATQLQDQATELEQSNLELHSAVSLLRQSEKRYRALVEASTLMVWSTDASGMVEDLPLWRELTGQTLEEVRGNGWTDAIHPDDRPRTLKMWRAAHAARAVYQAEYRVRLANATYRWYSARGVPVIGPDGEVREWIGVFNDIDQAMRRDVGTWFLAEASIALAESRGELGTLETVAKLAIEGLADGCMITLLANDGSFEHVAIQSREDQIAGLVADMERMYPLPVDAPSGYPRVIRTGEAELVTESAFNDIPLPHAAHVAEHVAERVALMRRVGMYSAMIVPLTARGRTLGAMTLALHGPARRAQFDAHDLAIASELGRRAGIALDNARAYAAEETARTDAERAVELSRRLQAITAAFARVLSVADVAETTLSQGLDALSAQAGVVYRMNPLDRVLELVDFRGVPADAIGPWERVALDMPMPVSDAVRTGETLYFGERSAPVEQYPDLKEARKIVEADAWIAVPLFHGGECLGAVALGFDGAHHFSAENRALVDALGRHCAQAMERARLLAAERAAREEAESANRVRSDFLATMSHELRTPLNAIAGYVELIEMGLRGAVTDAQREDLTRIRRSQRRLLSLVNDVLNFAKIDAGHVRYDITDVALDDLIAGVEALVLPQLRAKGLAYTFDSPLCRFTVRADRERLEQILINLLSNAIKFTVTGGVVTVTCEARHDAMLIHVSDTGVGVPEDNLNSIFDPFVQVESGHTRTAEGTGLGLAISRELATGMGAAITVRSERGIGSTFTVVFPAFTKPAPQQAHG